MLRAVILILVAVEVAAAVLLSASALVSSSTHERTFGFIILAVAALFCVPATLLTVQGRRLGLALALALAPPMVGAGALVLLFQMIAGW